MNPRAKAVIALGESKLKITFTNKEIKIFDMTPYFSYPVYERLSNPILFKKVFISNGTVAWNDEIDLDPDRLYLESITNS